LPVPTPCLLDVALYKTIESIFSVADTLLLFEGDAAETSLHFSRIWKILKTHLFHHLSKISKYFKWVKILQLVTYLLWLICMSFDTQSPPTETPSLCVRKEKRKK
jgi:hypothetical protein